METEVKPKNFRRLSAAAAKSVIIQGIREGERRIQQEAYENKHEEIITATVSKMDSETGNILLETDTGRAVLLQAASRFPAKSSTWATRSRSTFWRSTRKAAVRLSRCRGRIPGLVRRMFELEIPEIADGIVLVKGVAREAGSRTKIAVMSRDP